jgi:hypothetical protein
VILLVGIREDGVLTTFEEFLKQSKQKYIFFDQKYILGGNEVLDSELVVRGKRYSYNAFSGVLPRISSPNEEFYSAVGQRYYAAISYLSYIIDHKFNNVLNKTYLGYSNDSKLFQLSLLKLQSIRKPTFQILSKLDIDLSLVGSVRNKAIVKSLSSVRSKVVQYQGNEKKYFLKKSHEPVLFQELIEGQNIRVHVVDNECFAVKITSSSLDYRYGDNAHYEKVELPHKLYEECIDIAKQLHLRFCGIDLIKKNQEYYILEANPSPGWTHFEKSVGYTDISQKVLKTLLQNVGN